MMIEGSQLVAQELLTIDGALRYTNEDSLHSLNLYCS